MRNFYLSHGDCLDILRAIPDETFDSVVCDPPYALPGGFMGKKWDKFTSPQAFQEWVHLWASECLRVLKPGGYLVAFGGTKTYHRLACGVEDAGFDIRDQVMWLYGGGMPKSMDLSKALDKAAGAEREVVGIKQGHEEFANRTTKGHMQYETGALSGFDRPWMHDEEKRQAYHLLTAPATEEAQKWQGWGTSLKPAHEPIVIARKPLIGTLVANVLVHGTGAINIDGCRVEWPEGKVPAIGTPGWGGPAKKLTVVPGQDGETVERTGPNNLGRWPANVIHDGSDEVLEEFAQYGNCGAKAPVKGTEASEAVAADGIYNRRKRVKGVFHGDSGSAARFFYCAKPSRKERNLGLEDPGPQFEHGATLRKIENTETKGNTHPTVKPLALMRYLVRLVTPPGGKVLDPFMGSGTTGMAAILEGFDFEGIDSEEAYIPIATARIAWAVRESEETNP